MPNAGLCREIYDCIVRHLRLGIPRRCADVNASLTTTTKKKKGEKFNQKLGANATKERQQDSVAGTCSFEFWWSSEI